MDISNLLTQISGLFLLMFALYKITKGIGVRPQNDSFIENDEEEWNLKLMMQASFDLLFKF